MRFEIPESLVPKLRELQSEQNYPDDVSKSEDAVVLTLGLGPAMYLTLDGRVIIHAYMDDEVPSEASEPKEVYAAIVIGAKTRNAPELLSLLPQRPQDAVDCAACKGGGWVSFGKDAHGEPIEIVCWGCGGVGWATRS